MFDNAADHAAEEQAERLRSVVDAERGAFGVRWRNARDQRGLQRFKHVEPGEEGEQPEGQRDESVAEIGEASCTTTSNAIAAPKACFMRPRRSAAMIVGTITTKDSRTDGR